MDRLQLNRLIYELQEVQAQTRFSFDAEDRLLKVLKAINNNTPDSVVLMNEIVIKDLPDVGIQ